MKLEKFSCINIMFSFAGSGYKTTGNNYKNNYNNK